MGLITLKSLLIITIISVILAVGDTKPIDGELVNVAKLNMFVDKLPGMPKIYGFEMKNGVHVSKSLEIGMFMKRWVFYFQNFLLCPISSSLLSSLANIDCKSFGLNVKSSAIDEDGDAVLEWENLPPLNGGPKGGQEGKHGDENDMAMDSDLR
ncbi:hypothetical protein Scep_029904 [Stephania cephalantha]|uniref:Transmembrane protein n=1 Tax=Stephania cephalantha TaxID=152367 RepID=A0AAP0E1W4_9MAGN